MARRNGAGLNQCSSTGEARQIDRLAGAIDLEAKSEPTEKQPRPGPRSKPRRLSDLYDAADDETFFRRNRAVRIRVRPYRPAEFPGVELVVPPGHRAVVIVGVTRDQTGEPRTRIREIVFTPATSIASPLEREAS